jgi:uncharacterized membrane protein YhaH (DUF805 family)
MQFINAIKFGFINYAKFSGVVGRSVFWYWYLFVALLNIPVTLFISTLDFAGSSSGEDVLLVLLLVPNFALLVPTLALAARRLRDAGKSPLHLLSLLIPAFTITLGGFLGVFAYQAFTGSSSVGAPLASLFLVLLGAALGLLVGGAISGIWLLVLLVSPTRTRLQGNKYAAH